MRVLHIGKFFPPYAGGIEQFMADLLPALRTQGITPAALVHGHRGHNGICEDYHGCRVYRARCHGRLLYAPVSPTFPAWLQRAIGEFQPQLLHLHLPNTSAFWALLSPAARRLPWLVHWHADVVTGSLERRLRAAYRLYRPLEQRLLARSRVVAVTSPDYLRASAALAAWRQRCQIIPLGLDPQRLPPPTSAERLQAAALWPTDGYRILAVGRLAYYKGFEVLLQALAAHSQLQLVIVGRGERYDRLSARLAALGLRHRVCLAGYQPDPVRNALLAECDILCLPSLERTEAFGMVLLEAMRFARPIVASDIPGSGVGWVIRRSGAGVLVPAGDSDALGNALAALARDAGQRRALGTSGAYALQQHFAIGPVAAQIAALYRAALGVPTAPERTPRPAPDAETGD